MNRRIDLGGLATQLRAAASETGNKTLRKLMQDSAEGMEQAEKVLISVPDVIQQARVDATQRTAIAIMAIADAFANDYERPPEDPRRKIGFASTALRGFVVAIGQQFGDGRPTQGKKKLAKPAGSGLILPH